MQGRTGRGKRRKEEEGGGGWRKRREKEEGEGGAPVALPCGAPSPVHEGPLGRREGEEGALALPGPPPGVAAAGAGEEELASVGVHRDGGHPGLARHLKQNELLNFLFSLWEI